MMHLITQSTLKYQTYNPIISEEKVRLSHPFHHPTPEPGVALVLFREGEKCLTTLWPGNRITAFKVIWHKYKIIYKIDISEHLFSFSCPLPCQNDAFDFHAELQLVCKVDNPATIVERKITDARAVLEPLITRTIRYISRNYDVEEVAKAEMAIANAVEEGSYNIGFELSHFVAKLTLEKDASDYIRKLRELERTKARERKEAELERQRETLEIERLKIKMDFYSPLIKEGQWQLLALQLTSHPEDVATIIKMLNQQQQAELDNHLKALKIMLEQDGLEEFRIEETGKQILQHLVKNLGLDLQQKTLSSPQENPDHPKEEMVGSKSVEIETKEERQLRTVPLLANLLAVAVKPMTTNDIEAQITFDQSVIREVEFALRVPGDDLSHIQIFAEDIILVGPQNMVKKGDLAVIILTHVDTTAEEVIFRRIFFNQHRVCFISEHPNSRPLTFTKRTVKGRLRVIGPVVGFTKERDIKPNKIISVQEISASTT